MAQQVGRAAVIEARRVLRGALHDVLPRDARIIGDKSVTLDRLQENVVMALAALIQRHDEEGAD